MLNIVDHDWQFPNPLTARDTTSYFVIHHTDGPQMQDVNEIWQEHVNEGWNGIGYHYVIKGDGTIVRGRPHDTIGAHAHGINSVSVGIALEGDFQSTESQENPTDDQLASLKGLLTELYSIYGNSVQIIGHSDAAGISGNPDDATACPGDTLYKLIPSIIKAVLVA